MTDQFASLSWDVHVAPPEPMPGGDLAPGEEGASWSPISADADLGRADAVLVDALLTVGQSQRPGRVVAAHRRT